MSRTNLRNWRRRSSPEALGGDTQRGIRPRFDGVSSGILRYPEVSVNMRHCGSLRDAYKNLYI
jgi:hypothetical protein